MANNISNHFAITALQEGVTVQGSLRVDGTLSQNFNKRSSVPVPDWKAWAADPQTLSQCPSVYPVIRRGSVYMSRAQIYNAKWYYNGVEIEFGSDNKSTNFKDAAGDPLFKLGTVIKELGGTDYTLDYLTIIGNLATEANLDIDTITYEGSVELNGKQVAFPPCSVEIKISEMSTQGYLGLLSPESAIISKKGDKVTIAASLYDDAGNAPGSWFVKWLDAGTGAELAFGSHITKAANGRSITVDDEGVVDNLVVRADFYTDSAMTNRVTTAFASIDDTQDPEYLYISLNANNADFSGQLSPGEECIVTMWVATMEDSTAINKAYTKFDVKFYDGSQAEITSGTPTVTVADNKGTCRIGYAFVQNNHYKITGIVTAS